jgi:transposase InsO family protein
VSTTDSKHDLAVAENLLARQFEVGRPNEVWVSDITYRAPR